MSVVSKNIFDLLGDDGDDSPSPAPAKPAAPAASKPAAAPAPSRNVPGSAPRGGAGGAQRGRGSYTSRGGARSNQDREREPRNSGPVSGEGNVEGTENAGGFDGERVPPSRKANHVRDAHTKGPRGGRPARGGGDRDVTSGGHSSFGSGHFRGNKVPSGAGERGRFERKNLNGGNDSQKKVEHGWGANTGEAELKDEVEGEKDAQVEENQPATPAPEGADGEETAAAEPAAEPAAPVEPEEPEEVTKSYDEYLAERAQQAIAGIGKKQAREVSTDLEGKAFVREGIDEFFSGKAKTSETKEAKAKKEKVYIEFDGQFARPPREDRGPRPERGERSERGTGSGRGNGRGRGSRGGFGGDRGAPRGAARGGARGGRAPAGINANDTNAFPALGA